jgi:pimeloyl-[acyl-carrier protein] methyl ester esterase
MIEKTSGKVFIAGWSLGGMIALETAFHRPDLFNGLVLISSTAKFCSGPGWPAGIPPAVLRTMTRKFKRDRKEVLRDFFRNVAMPSAETDENILLKIEKACAMNPLELSAGLEYLSEADLRGKIVKLKVPALVLHGRQDLVIPAEAGMALKDMLALSKIRVYDNYGHGLPWQNPRAVAGDIKEFLQECRKRDTQQARL